MAKSTARRDLRKAMSTSKPEGTTKTMKSGFKNNTPSPTLVRFAHLQRKYQPFLKLRLEVQANPEGVTGVCNALGKLLDILQAADETVQLALYKGGTQNSEKLR